MEQFTCVKKDDKYVVMEYMGEKPDILGMGLSDYYEQSAIWKRNDAISYANALPTLPEHTEYWSTMENKVFDEEVFEVRSFHTPTIVGSYAYVNHAIPKQQEQDLWEEVEKLYNFGEFNGMKYFSFSKFANYMKQHYTPLTRKQP